MLKPVKSVVIIDVLWKIQQTYNPCFSIINVLMIMVIMSYSNVKRNHNQLKVSGYANLLCARELHAKSS